MGVRRRTGWWLAAVLAVTGVAPGSAQALVQGIEERSLAGDVRVLEAGDPGADAAVLLLHDWFGVTDATREALGRLASLGYHAIALDLYDGESADAAPRAQALMNGLVQAEVQAKVATALDHLRSDGRPLAAVGFSMGGNVAFRSSIDHDDVLATASVYGGGLEAATEEELAGLSAPLLIVTGSADPWPMGSVQNLRPRMDAAGKAFESYVYPLAGHGYAQPLWAGGANLDETATDVTWSVLANYLKRHLGS